MFDLAPGISFFEDFQGALVFWRGLSASIPAVESAQDEGGGNDHQDQDQDPKQDSKTMTESTTIHHKKPPRLKIQKSKPDYHQCFAICNGPSPDHRNRKGRSDVATPTA
ncbi:hypothetical protein [Thioalkalivibrio sp.]|uniref:hypothetical protein n=1 Tax=Thioalkalivibrio sp. TaxID=2093813 RepID=UPI0035655324